MESRPEREDARAVDDFRVVLTGLKAHSRLPGTRQRAGSRSRRIAGHLLVRAEGRTLDLPTGTLLALDQDLPHKVHSPVAAPLAARDKQWMWS
jgi:hypothetical protein